MRVGIASRISLSKIVVRYTITIIYDRSYFRATLGKNVEAFFIIIGLLIYFNSDVNAKTLLEKIMYMH